jgi:hypothetical protein
MTEEYDFNKFLSELASIKSELTTTFKSKTVNEGSAIVGKISVEIPITGNWSDTAKKLARRSGFKVNGDTLILAAKGDPEDIIAKLREVKEKYMAEVERHKSGGKRTIF